jgi:ATP-binding cassette subfamily B protein/subfamily B ATP-binding cassette protein MsbA
VVLSVALLSAAEVFAPFPLKILVDNVLGDNPTPAVLSDALGFLPGPDGRQGLLLLVCTATVLLFAVAALAEMAATVAATRLGQRMTFDLAADLFMHLQRLSLLFHSRRPTGDVIARVTGDTYGLQLLVTGVTTEVLQASITLVAMFAIMLQLSPSLTLLALAVVPVQVLAIAAFKGSMRERSRKRRDLEGGLLSLVQQTLTAVPVVQAFTRERIEHERFRDHTDRTVVAYVRESMAGSWFKLFAGLATAAGTAGVFYVGAQLALDGTITLGTVLVFLAYLTALYGPLTNITYMASSFQEARAQLDRVAEILELEHDVRDASGAGELRIRAGRIRYEDVSFTYDREHFALERVTFDARPGETVAIVGPTGAGKSTIANLLVRFFDPTAGRVTVDGEDIRGVKVRSLREQVAMVLQEPFILPLSVAENIAYARPGASRGTIMAAARAAGADEFINRLPQGWETPVGEGGATLSGGERQRLSIARAFLKNAPILVLDEPTSALDAHTESALLAALESLSEGRTTLIIAHRLSTIRKADRILVLDRGRVVEHGEHWRLIAADGLYASLYRQQTEVDPRLSAMVADPISAAR